MHHDWKKQVCNGLSICIPVFLCFIFCGCESSVEEIPSFIHIEKINLHIDTAKQGTASSNITDAWVYVDNSYLGTFELPATFPVLKAGSHTVNIKAGIKINGVASTRTPYPFYTSFQANTELQPGKISILEPLVNYNSSTSFIWKEDFENEISLSASSRSDTTIGVTEDVSLVFEGKKSGVIYLNDSESFCEFISKDNFALPKNGRSVYLELNYKTNFPFLIGVYANESTKVTVLPVGGGNPTSTWKKLYLDLTSTVSSSIYATDFNIFLSMSSNKNSDLHTLFIDNLKLVYL